MVKPTHSTGYESVTTGIKPERNLKARVLLTALGVGGLGLFLAATAGASQNTTPKAEVPICIVPVDAGTHNFTLESGMGVNDLIHSIRGSGAGEGDPCWNAAEAIAQDALDTQEAIAGHNQARAVGATVILPDVIVQVGR